MSRPSLNKLTTLALVLLTAPVGAQTTGTWQSLGNGPYNWTDAANWVGGVVPNGPFDTANMSVAALTGFPDISLNQQIQLRNLTVGSGANGYFFEPGTAGYFAFGSSSTITAGSQGLTIFAPFTTAGGLAVNTTVAGSDVGFVGRVEPTASLSSAILTKSGPGSVDFSNGFDQTVFLDIVVNGGFVHMELPTALAASNVTLNVTNGLQFSTLTAASVASVSLSSNANLALINSDTPQAAVALTTGGGSVSGTSVVSGPGSLNVANGGSMGFTGSAAQTYSGGTTVSSGSLLLDLSNMASPTNMLNPSQTLTLGAGQFQLNGKANAASSQAFTGFGLAGGQAAVILQQSGTGTTTLTLPNTWGRVAGATVDFTIPAGTTVSSAPVASGFVGAFATVNGNDWASVSGGVLVPFSGYVNNTFTAGTHVNVTGTQSSGTATVASIRMDDGSSLALSGTMTVSTGGVLLRGNTISGGTLVGPASGELIVNTGTVGGGTLSSTIADNGGATALTVAGTGGVTLGGANTYTGPTYLNVATTIPALADGGTASGIGQSPNSAGSLVFNGGLLTATAGGFSDRLFTLGPAGGGFSANGRLFFTNVNAIGFTGVGSRTLTLSGGSTDVTNPNVFSPVLGDPIGGSLGVTINGGAWVLGANNSFTGPLLAEVNATVITNTLAMRGAAGPLGASNRPDGLTFALGSTLQYTGSSVTTDRPILFQPGSLNVTTAGTNVTLTGGGINGDLTLTGPGTVTFGGQRPYTGGLIVNNGQAILADNNAFAGVAVTPNIPTGGFLFAPGVTTPTLSGFNGPGNINLQTTASETVNISLIGASNYSGVLSGPGSVTIVSGGHTFSGPNTYSGGTTIQANGIIASNTSGSATGSGPVVITGGALSGNGTVTGPVTLQGPNSSTLAGGNLTVTGSVTAANNAAFLQPGRQFNQPGLLTLGDTTINGGANYIWAVSSWTATPVAGTDFGQIKGVTGTTNLNMTGASVGNPINLFIEGNPTGFNQTQGRQWLIASYGSLTNFSAANWVINTNNFTPALGTGAFSLSQSGNGGILLSFNPVPEPWAVMSVCGLAAGCWVRWRRRAAV
jgi:fibronectin-binding autotransporter adhesin